jgi:hypothetical protein
MGLGAGLETEGALRMGLGAGLDTEGALRMGLGAGLDTEGALRMGLGAGLDTDGALRIGLGAGLDTEGALRRVLGAGGADGAERGAALGAGVLLTLRAPADGVDDGPPMVTERVGAALRGGVRWTSAGRDCCEGGDVTGAVVLLERVPGVSAALLRGIGVIASVPLLMLRPGDEVL